MSIEEPPLEDFYARNYQLACESVDNFDIEEGPNSNAEYYNYEEPVYGCGELSDVLWACSDRP